VDPKDEEDEKRVVIEPFFKVCTGDFIHRVLDHHFPKHKEIAYVTEILQVKHVEKRSPSLAKALAASWLSEIEHIEDMDTDVYPDESLVVSSSMGKKVTKLLSPYVRQYPNDTTFRLLRAIAYPHRAWFNMNYYKKGINELTHLNEIVPYVYCFIFDWALI
jgi:hypothetical protein